MFTTFYFYPDGKPVFENGVPLMSVSEKAPDNLEIETELLRRSFVFGEIAYIIYDDHNTEIFRGSIEID